MERDLRRWGKRETIPNAALSPPEWFCIKIGSGASHFNVSFIVGVKVAIVHKTKLLKRQES